MLYKLSRLICRWATPHSSPNSQMSTPMPSASDMQRFAMKEQAVDAHLPAMPGQCTPAPASPLSEMLSRRDSLDMLHLNSQMQDMQQLRMHKTHRSMSLPVADMHFAQTPTFPLSTSESHQMEMASTMFSSPFSDFDTRPLIASDTMHFRQASLDKSTENMHISNPQPMLFSGFPSSAAPSASEIFSLPGDQKMEIRPQRMRSDSHHNLGHSFQAVDSLFVPQQRTQRSNSVHVSSFAMHPSAEFSNFNNQSNIFQSQPTLLGLKFSLYPIKEVVPVSNSPVVLKPPHPQEYFTQTTLGPFDQKSSNPSITEEPLAAPGSRFKCTHVGCTSAFAAMQNLRSHMRCHLKVAPHVCTQCGAGFRRNTDLQRHTRTIHTSESQRPWPCTHCGRRFGRSDALKRHLSSRKRNDGCTPGSSRASSPSLSAGNSNGDGDADTA